MFDVLILSFILTVLLFLSIILYKLIQKVEINSKSFKLRIDEINDEITAQGKVLKRSVDCIQLLESEIQNLKNQKTNNVKNNNSSKQK